MELEFRIEFVFKNPSRKSPHFLACMLTRNGRFNLTENLTLGGYGIKNMVMTRVLDEQGNPRFDIFAFVLKDKSEIGCFKKGQVLKLVE